MQKDTQTEAGLASHLTQQIYQQNKPTFVEWLRENKIEMTTREAIDWAMLAAKKGVSVQKLIGYPYA